MKYELIIENNLKQTALKRVRIKVDPSLVYQAEDLSQCDGYEGYVLAETGDVPKVLVMSPDGVSSVMDIPQQFLQMLMSDEESEALRAFKEYICNICELDTSTPEAEILLNAATIEEIEAILKQVGLTDDELKVLYRSFIADSGETVNEGVFSSLLKQAGKAVGRTVISPAAWAKGVGNVINTIDPGNKIGTAATGLGGKLDQAFKSFQRFKKDYKFNQQHLQEYKTFAIKRYPKMADTINKSVSIEDANNRIKKALLLKDAQIEKLYSDFFKQPDIAKDPDVAKAAKDDAATKAPTTTKPEPNEVFTVGTQKYIWGGTGWTYPGKTDPKAAGAYVTDTALKKQIMDAWTKYKAS